MVTRYDSSADVVGGDAGVSLTSTNKLLVWGLPGVPLQVN